MTFDCTHTLSPYLEDGASGLLLRRSRSGIEHRSERELLVVYCHAPGTGVHLT